MRRPGAAEIGQVHRFAGPAVLVQPAVQRRQVLPPVERTVHGQPVGAGRAARRLVEKSQVVRPDGKRRDGLRREQDQRQHEPAARPPGEAPERDEQHRIDRQDVAVTDVEVAGDGGQGHDERGHDQGRGLQPAGSIPAAAGRAPSGEGPEAGHGQRPEHGQRRLREEHYRKELPPAREAVVAGEERRPLRRAGEDVGQPIEPGFGQEVPAARQPDEPGLPPEILQQAGPGRGQGVERRPARRGDPVAEAEKHPEDAHRRGRLRGAEQDIAAEPAGLAPRGAAPQRIGDAEHRVDGQEQQAVELGGQCQPAAQAGEQPRAQIAPLQVPPEKPGGQRLE